MITLFTVYSISDTNIKYKLTVIVKQLWISPTNILKASLKNTKLRLADKCISNVTAYWQLIASLAIFWLSFVYFTCKID